MKVSVNWLQTFFEEPLPDAAILADTLTFGVAEIEEVVRVGGDMVIDVKVLPDRACYMLSHRGVAKELSILLGMPMKGDPLVLPSPNLAELPASNLQIEIDDLERCPAYSAALMSGVRVGPSPLWLKERLEAIGQRSINNVVDATNYVMFTLGTPLHAFDAGKFQAEDGRMGIRIRAAKAEETITVLGGDSYTLTEEMTVIADDNSNVPLAIAGIKGGTQAEVDVRTTDIVLEAAKFAPVRTRKSSQALKLRTDASYRFENEIADELPLYGLVAVVKLIEEIAGGTLDGYASAGSAQPVARTVTVFTHYINSRLGTAITDQLLVELLTKLGFATEQVADGEYCITVPFERLDIRDEADLSEEVGRVFGYDAIPEQRLSDVSTPPVIDTTYAYTELVHEALEEAGFSEVYTYSLQPSGLIHLDNPLASDKGFLRANLSGGLTEKLLLNENNAPLLGFDAIRMYEIGTVFTEEGESLRAAVSVRFPTGKKKEQQTSEALSDARTALMTVFGATCAVLSETKESLEWDLSALIANAASVDHYSEAPLIRGGETYRPSSPYPFVLRDIAAWTPEGTSAEDFEQLIRHEAGDLLVRVNLFDQFTKGDRTSYAFRLVFQSSGKTLTDIEVNGIMDAVYAACREAGFETR